MKPRNGVKPWTVVAMSGVVSAVVVVAVGAFCALLDPILQGKRDYLCWLARSNRTKDNVRE